MMNKWDEVLQNIKEREFKKKVMKRFFKLLGDRYTLWNIGEYDGKEEYNRALKEVLDEYGKTKKGSRRDFKGIR